MEANTKTKLKTYLKIYDERDPKAIISTYLTRYQHSLLAKFKLGILPLEIESGRWKDTPLEYRQCKLCKECLLGDEFHFAFYCDKLQEERTNMFVELCNITDIDVESNEVQLLKDIFQRDCLKTLGRHIEILYSRRKELLYSREK